MQLTEMFTKLQGLEIYEQRSLTNELAELVFENKNILSWHQQLESILGPALKSPGTKATAETKKLTKPFGGIRFEQSLYYKNFGAYAIMAMFWPWQNGKCTTCKIHYLA